MKKIILSLLMAVLLVGCSTGNSSAIEPIIGLWETSVPNPDGSPNMLFQFNEDGTYRWYESALNIEDNYYYGQYTVVNGAEAMMISAVTNEELSAVDGNPKPEQVYVITLVHNGVFQGGVDTKRTSDGKEIQLMLVLNKSGNELYGMNANTYTTYTMKKLTQ